MSQNRIIIFCDPDFPAAGLIPQAGAFGKTDGVNIVGAAELADALRGLENGCFVNLHAPYFPKSAWTEISAFLHRGKFDQRGWGAF